MAMNDINLDYKEIQTPLNINIDDLDNDIKEFYKKDSGRYQKFLDQIFLNKRLDEEEILDRPTPNYANGFLDKPFLQGGKPIRPKDLEVYNAVLSGNYKIVEIEGGVRGGKDIIALLAWARYLMVCPDKTHMAMGSSLEHVLKTVLMSNGFGIYFLIPHGKFVRESSAGGIRGVFKFQDSYGLPKEVLFYGNDKENDSDKFQGFTLGSVYVNETLNQHIRGLVQAENRMASVKQPLMILTQNPKGKANKFYTVFESAKLNTLKEVEKIEYYRDKLKDKFELIENEFKNDRDMKRKELIEKFLVEKGISKIGDEKTIDRIKRLTNFQQIELNRQVLELNFEFDSYIRNITVGELDLECDAFIKNFSMKKVANYFRGDKKPTEVYNAYNFYYQHYTVDDNMSMSEIARYEFKNSRAIGTSSYEQEIQGLRRSSDGAVFSMFSDKNILRGDIEQYIKPNLIKVSAIDKGLNHPSGIVIGYIDFEQGIFYQLWENLLDFKKFEGENLGFETIYTEFLETVRKEESRRMPETILIDPSSIELQTFLKLKGLPIQPAVNAVWSIRGLKEDSHQRQDKDLIGIPMLQTAIAKLKYFVHETCYNTIEQIGSYEAPFDENLGKEKVKKVNDDLVDPVRYIFNTLIRMGSWGDTINGEEETKSLQEQEQDTRTFINKQLNQLLYGEQPRKEEQPNNFFYNGFNFFN